MPEIIQSECNPSFKSKKKYDLLQIFRTLSQVGFAVFFAFFSVFKLPYLFPVLIILTVVGGSFFCGWMCPLGFFQDLARSIAGRFRIRQKSLLPRKVHLVVVVLRYLLFFVVLATNYYFISFVGRLLFHGDARRSTHTLLSAQAPSFTALGILLVFLIMSIFYKRVFCSYFCIEGAKQGLLGLFRPVTILRNTDTCINCKKCDRACPMCISVSTSGNVQSTQCVNCFQCISSCPVKDTLTFGIVQPKHDPLGARLMKKSSLPRPLRFGVIGLRLALGFAAFFYWFIGPGMITAAPRIEIVPSHIAHTGASVVELGRWESEEEYPLQDIDDIETELEKEIAEGLG